MLTSLFWLVAIASLVGVWANIDKKRWCFAVWMVTNAIWVTRNIWIGEWPQAILFLCYFILAVVGWMRW